MPFAVAPVNRPLSSVMVGAVGGVGVEAAKTVAAAAQIATSNTRREAMITREKKRMICQCEFSGGALSFMRSEQEGLMPV